jgi:CRP/FNR family transcriptional regulator, polysaccharide utilization system transcription regulator
MKKPFVIPECANCSSRVDSVFTDLDASQIEELSNQKGCNYYKKGQTVFFEGNNSHGIYCVHKGKLKLHKLGTEGKEQIIRFAKDGDILGYRALLSGEPFAASASVLEDSSLCYIPKDSLIKLITEDPSFSMKVLELTCKEMGRAADTITNLAQKPVRERLAEVLLMLKEVFGLDDEGAILVQLSREELANIVGTATESVIRLLSELKKECTIELKGKMIAIKNEQELIHICNLYE